jgi:hypothetical protein
MGGRILPMKVGEITRRGNVKLKQVGVAWISRRRKQRCKKPFLRIGRWKGVDKLRIEWKVLTFHLWAKIQLFKSIHHSVLPIVSSLKINSGTDGQTERGTKGMTDWTTEWYTDWLTDWLTDGPTDRLADWMSKWVIGLMNNSDCCSFQKFKSSFFARLA